MSRRQSVAGDVEVFAIDPNALESPSNLLGENCDSDLTDKLKHLVAAKSAVLATARR